MTETPQQIASRLLGHAGEYTLFKTEQVRALIIKAVEEERARTQPSASLPMNQAGTSEG